MAMYIHITLHKTDVHLCVMLLFHRGFHTYDNILYIHICFILIKHTISLGNKRIKTYSRSGLLFISTVHYVYWRSQMSLDPLLWFNWIHNSYHYLLYLKCITSLSLSASVSCSLSYPEFLLTCLCSHQMT